MKKIALKIFALVIAWIGTSTLLTMIIAIAGNQSLTSIEILESAALISATIIISVTCIAASISMLLNTK